MHDPLGSRWTRLTLVAVFMTPLAVGFWLESRWLTQAGVCGLLVHYASRNSLHVPVCLANNGGRNRSAGLPIRQRAHPPLQVIIAGPS
jgi:hypothetical protein